jgi:hypothetical protein
LTDEEARWWETGGVHFGVAPNRLIEISPNSQLDTLLLFWIINFTRGLPVSTGLLLRPQASFSSEQEPIN